MQEAPGYRIAEMLAGCITGPLALLLDPADGLLGISAQE